MGKGLMWDDEIDDFYVGYRERLITTEEIDDELDRIINKENRFHNLRKIRAYFVDKLDRSYEKFVLYVLKDIMLKEIKKDYYQDIHNVEGVIDVNSYLMERFVGGIDYMHIENLCIWQNGFYSFNCFNIRLKKTNNFNEEIAYNLEKFGFGGNLIPIEEQEKGTKEDYTSLEAKILKMSTQNESYTE